MALSEIEKLERRYAENPQGLTFAPLAEVHRKNGEVQRALNLLGPGLQIHPDYIPASIVLGRCHMDLGDVHAAETAFLHVLDLDGENVIALKALADISERLLRFDEAERWLHTLLTVDRSNDDAREQLQRVEIARRQAGVASSAEPSSVLEAPTAADEEEPALAPIPDIAPTPPPFQPPVAEPVRGSIGFADLEPSALDLEPSALRDEFAAGSDEARSEGTYRFDESVAPLDGLVGREVDTPDEADSELTIEPGFRGDFSVETSDDIVLQSAGGSEFQMPDASLELFAGGAKGERAPFEEDAPISAAEAEPTSAEPTSAEPTSAEPTSAEPTSAEPTSGEQEAQPAESEPAGWSAREPEASLQEWRAPEPYEQKNYEFEPSAAARYEPEPSRTEPSEPDEPSIFQPTQHDAAPPELVAESPAPESPTPEVLAAEPAAPEVPAAAPVVEAAPPPAASQPKRAYGVSDTGGRSVAQLFQGILAARPPAQATPAPVRQAAQGGGGAPTRPAADALSLSSVFGDETSETPPAVPAQNPASGSVSFDDFFGSSSPSPSPRTPRSPDPKNDDLDQFHAWLQNLKR
jgi:tetratricopeptide (TPR) repeat protein